MKTIACPNKSCEMYGWSLTLDDDSTPPACAHCGTPLEPIDHPPIEPPEDTTIGDVVEADILGEFLPATDDD